LNKEFRIAMSLATDRQEVIDVVYAGQGEPFQAAPRPESPFYNEEMAKQYTEYDPDTADKMLDAMGLTERDDNGIRKLPDGRSIVIRIDVSTDLGPQLDILELVQLHWEDVGIKLDVRKSERSYVYEQKDTNKHMAHVWKGDGGLGDAQLDPRYYLPMHEDSAYAMLWAKNWFAPDAADVAELPEAVQAQYDAYRAMFASPDEAERTKWFQEVLKISQEQFYTIGISLPPLSFGVATNVMGNVPVNQPHSWVYPNPGPMNTSLLFKRQ
jgi:peptide/nickel transport system substrate-binding protein